MSSLVSKYWKVAVATVIMMAIGFGVAFAFTLTGNQILTGGNIISAEADGSLISSNASCNFNAPASGYPTNRTVRNSDFTNCVANNGACTGPGTRQMTWNDALACRVLTSTIGAVTDPWMINSGTSWATVAGSPIYQTDGNALAGEPSGAKNVSNGSVQQQLTPATINNTTPIVARAYLEATSNSYIDNGTSLCPGSGATTTATGTAAIQVVRADGTVMASTSATSGTLTQYAASATANSTTGYYIRVVTTTVTTTASRTIERIDGTCTSNTVTLTGIGYGLDATAANS